MFSSRLTIDWVELIASKEYIQDMENLAARLNNVEEFAGCTI
jgi:hypothetical protein